MVAVSANHFDDRMPPDPFNGKYDAVPGSEDNFGVEFDFDEMQPVALTAQERAEIEHDLAVLREARATLGAQGERGVVVHCDDCNAPHFFDWDLLEEHMMGLLAGRPMPPHEPIFEPEEERYVSWDYCVGFVHGRRSRRWFGR